MPLVRVVAAHDPAAIRQHLRRLGLEPAAVDAEARRASGVGLLVTGAGEAAIAALGRLRDDAGHLAVALGDPDRASGTAFVSGPRGAVDALVAALAKEGPDASLVARGIATALERNEGAPPPLRIGRRTFDWSERAYVMGVINVTPDSFSDGGKYLVAEAAVRAGEGMAKAGADLLDVGGESTRPGAAEVSEEEEMERVVPVIERLAQVVDVPISIDTMKARVAEAAVRAGATLVNDVSGFKGDVQMGPTLARLGVACCAMHMQGSPRTMQQNPSYFDVVGEVMESLQASLHHAVSCGVAEEKVLLDPGIGFGKTVDHNLFLLRHLGQLKALGRPILVGTSRKSFIGKLTGAEVTNRLAGTIASHTVALLAGAHLVRVHDVEVAVQAAKIMDAIRRAEGGGFAFL